MKRSIASLAVAALLTSALAACDKPGETEQKKEVAAGEQAAAARNRADRNVQAAQAQSERAVAAARADFERSREDYRHGRQQDIADVNKKIADLEAKQKTATGKERAILDSNLPALRARRDTFAADLQRLDDATPASWDGARASLDKEWYALKTALDEVS
jgi:predicted  nucleic acid-binding Zn-ribbon protein